MPSFWLLHLGLLLVIQIKGYGPKTFWTHWLLTQGNSRGPKMTAVLEDSSTPVLSLANTGRRFRTINQEWLRQPACTVAQSKHFQAARRHISRASPAAHRAWPHTLCALSRKWLTLATHGTAPIYSVPLEHLIVSIAITLTANKHSLVAHQLFDERKTGSLEMICMWGTPLLSFYMMLCFPSSLPQSLLSDYNSPQTQHQNTSQPKIFQHPLQSWGFSIRIPDVCGSWGFVLILSPSTYIFLHPST